MKLFYVFVLLLCGKVFAGSVVCHDTKFADIQYIQLEDSGDTVQADIVYTEEEVTTYNFDSSEDTAFEINLSDWNGYTRTFFKNNDSYYIEIKDECSSSLIEVLCN